MANVTVIEPYEEPLGICEKGAEGGFFFPLFGDNEADLPTVLKVIMYAAGLSWCFLGVSILADVFMGSIEVITSKKRRIFDKRTQRHRTVKIWNDTVANLTLMALGSSAPEILLNVLELFKEDWHAGALGPGTIVGSAAFNLLAIASVCVIAIPSPEIRFIKDTTVYMVTSSFSLFAYIWLLFILMGTSKDLVDLWEALVTLGFFPVLIVLAYLADRGYFGGTPKPQRCVVAAEMTKDELAEMIASIRMAHSGSELQEEQVRQLVERQTASAPSRAIYRLGRHPSKQRQMSHSGFFLKGSEEFHIEGSMQPMNLERGRVRIDFITEHYMVAEAQGKVVVRVRRRGDEKREVSVRYRTRDGTAEAGKDYVHQDDLLVFQPHQMEKDIVIKILDDEEVEDLEAFSVELYDAKGADGLPGVDLGRKYETTVKIIDDDHPGRLRFQKELVEIEEALEEDVDVNIEISRLGGCCGQIGCQVVTESDSAVSPLDFDAIDHQVVMAPGELSYDVAVKIKPRGRYGTSSQFRLILRQPTGGASFVESTDGGSDECICTIVIKANTEYMNTVDAVAKNLAINWGKAKLGTGNWKEQFMSLRFVGGSDESQAEAGVVEWVSHILALPWKVLFALIPPTEFADGWACFYAALIGIALVTAAISDLANLLGCVLELEPQITAITIVALGTSLPDTFASKTAAEQDPYADASIGNITGSNSVNVFLGLGLPWTMGAIYWKINGMTPEWRQRYECPDIIGVSCDFPDGGFVVRAGSLGFSVAVFSGCALACMFCLFVRRKLFGGELGGPFVPKVVTTVFLLTLWCLYVAASWIYAVEED
mmetsp:Transcript_75506/g.179346  ORF Transcript_75506/g.179346 Transcript_75506/m.179346 type:complete len:825 (+) Transcript_75506:75-2549(+)